MKDHFDSAVEKFEFTVDLGGWRGKKVFKFTPPQDEREDGHVSELSIFGKCMNVKSITNNGLMLYSFDILGNKITGKIKFKDVELGNTLDV
jgi:hypothetical protein